MLKSIYPLLNDKIWLYKQRVTNNRTISDIASEVGCDKGAVIRSMKRFNLTNIGEIRYPQLYDKKWFESELVTKSFRQIAKDWFKCRECGISSQKAWA